ncbi:hypothetical protein X566_17660 [Afipia sp. P52-10]|uniref:hypothetical protein n=1 Tax=Afipia sp. P52-10 TaxID=1429916 RepID=UPI0003DF04BE|nr:hypothetical protein [Afipia sp. P52-10]ETR76453.1 hypothetical protein X566_17660 [Afipia sp. P52-10]
MATDKQIAANRRNALKSTGPKTLVGRAASSRNAFRHGLTKPLTDDPRTLAAARQLADAIFGAATDPERRELHMHIALAHLEIRRVRVARNHTLSLLMTALDDSSDAQTLKHLGSFDRYERLARQRQKRTIRSFQKGENILDRKT